MSKHTYYIIDRDFDTMRNVLWKVNLSSIDDDSIEVNLHCYNYFKQRNILKSSHKLIKNKFLKQLFSSKYLID